MADIAEFDHLAFFIGQLIKPEVMLSLLFAIALANIQIFAGYLRFISFIPRSRWLSLAGGMSVAYAFVHLLPELSQRQQAFAGFAGLPYVERHVYLIALAGFAVFYGLERMAASSRQRNREVRSIDETTPGIFWVHIASFSIYSALTGYLLHGYYFAGWLSLVFFFIAMAVHFFIVDFALREHHKDAYTYPGRWLLAAGVLVGWAIGYLSRVNEAAITVLFAFLAGGMILNTIKEELPEGRRSRFLAFAAGAAAYTAMLLVF